MRRYTLAPIFTQFPTELVDEIVRYSAVGELKALCLVSRQTGDVATRRLYDTIVLENLKNAVLCFKTLAARQDVASCVRKIIIVVPCQDLFVSFYKLALAALRQTVNLIGLHISNMGFLSSLLTNVPFPRLVEVKMPFTPTLMSFLHTHRKTLRYIALSGPSRYNPAHPPFSPSTMELATSFRRIEMPELTAFLGSCSMIPYIIPGSQVQILNICWDPSVEHDDMEEMMKCVSQSRREVTEMDNLVLGWNPTLLGVIGMYVPRLVRLRITSVCPYVEKETIDTYLLFLEEGLEKFECLHTLAITLLFFPYEYRLADLDAEYEIVQRWGSLIPTLTVCTLPSTTRWARFKDRHWFPIVDLRSDPRRSIKVRWFFQAFMNGTYPGALFPEISGGIDLDVFEEMLPLEYFLADEEEVTDEDESESEDEDESD